MSQLTPVTLSVETKMACSATDSFSKIHSGNEKVGIVTGVESSDYYETCGLSNNLCYENGMPHELNVSLDVSEGKKLISNSKVKVVARDSEKNAKCFHKCNGISQSHNDHNSNSSEIDKSYIFNLNSSDDSLTLKEGCNSLNASLCIPGLDKDCKLFAEIDLGVQEDLYSVVEYKKHHLSNDDKHSPEAVNKEVDLLLSEIERTSLSGGASSHSDNFGLSEITYVVYESEKQMPDIMRLITKDLSEPYSIYTYRYFIHNWPKLCFLAIADKKCVGAIVCKLDLHKKMVRRGYIAMLAVDSEYRRRHIGSSLVTKAIEAMIRDDCDEVVLETEITNQAALHLYENLGFVRDKRLFRYYLNGVDALRLKLWLR